MNNKNLHRLFLILIFFLATFGAVENYIILKKDTVPFVYDVYNNYHLSSHYYSLMTKGQISTLVHDYHYKYHSIYPPLTIFQAFPFYYIFGLKEDSASLSNILHIFILLFSVYFIGKKIRNIYTGFLAALFILFIPGLLPLSRIYLPAFALTSMFSLSVALLLYTDFFKKRNYTILFAIATALGMLTKITFVFYIMPFTVIYVLKNLRTGIAKNQINNIVLSSVVMFLILTSWYPKNIYKVSVAAFNSQKFHNIVDFPDLDLWDLFKKNGFDYFFNIGYGFLFKMYLLLIIIACIYYIITKKFSKTKFKIIYPTHILISMILSYLSFLSIKANPRLVLPLTIFISMLVGSYLYDMFDFVVKKTKKKVNNDYFVIYIIILLVIMLT